MKTTFINVAYMFLFLTFKEIKLKHNLMARNLTFPKMSIWTIYSIIERVTEFQNYDSHDWKKSRDKQQNTQWPVGGDDEKNYLMKKRKGHERRSRRNHLGLHRNTIEEVSKRISLPMPCQSLNNWEAHMTK